MPTLPFTYPSGVSIAVTFTNQTSGMVWRIDTSALEAFTVANVANYGVVPAETPASSGRYPISSPAGLPVGWYKVDYYIIAGSSLASGDLSSWIGGNVTYFDGTSFYSDPSAVAIRQEMDANSTKLANLDAAVSSRLASASYTTAPSASQIRAELDTNSTKLATINTAAAAIQAKTDNLPANPAAVGSTMTIDATQAIPTTNTANTVGDCLNAARADGFGEWVKDGNILTLYAPDGITTVRVFTLNAADNPTARV